MGGVISRWRRAWVDGLVKEWMDGGMDRQMEI